MDEKASGWRLANQYAVPGTDHRSHGHWFRRPRNIGVKRALLSAFDTLRGIGTPPDSWDDLNIVAVRHRSWKRHRRTQWKEAGHV